MAKPAGYPLPWCDRLDAPYWQINLFLCAQRPGWREWQRKRDMEAIIPEIDALLSSASPDPHPASVPVVRVPFLEE